MIAALRDALAAIREALIIVAVLLVVFFPTEVGRWLVNHGLTKLEYGGATISLDQFRQTREALNAVAGAADALREQPEAKATLDTAAGQLRETLVLQARTIQQRDPDSLPRAGWVYLGTIGADHAAWRDGTSPTVREPWPLKAGVVVTFTTDVNLRADSTPETRPAARILTVLPGGTKARITELDLARPVPPNDRAAPGFRTWAKIEVLS